MLGLRKIIILLMFIVGTWLPGCVSPFYGKAQVERGLSMDAGLAVATYHVPITSGTSYSIGVRGDIVVGYGFNPYLKVDARGSVGLGTQFSGMQHPFFADAALGVQTCLPLGPLTPGLHVELSYYLREVTLSPTVLFGIGKKEWLTLGGRMHMHGFLIGWDPVAVDAFACAHLSPRYSVFAGAEIFYITYAPAITLGVGYHLK